MFIKKKMGCTIKKFEGNRPFPDSNEKWRPVEVRVIIENYKKRMKMSTPTSFWFYYSYWHRSGIRERFTEKK